MLSRNRLSGAAIVIAFVLVCVSSGSVAAPGRPIRQEELELDALLEQALVESRRYSEVFQNLTAEETQERVVHDDDGRISVQRAIVSDFVVYRSTLEDGRIEEYRDIRMVDGEPVGDASERQRALSSDLADAGTVEDELARIREESDRFDIGFRYAGLSLTTEQISYRSREAFESEVVGREAIGERTLVLVRLRQVAQTPRITFNIRGFPDDVEFVWHGVLWLDADTGELWRSEDQIMAVGPPRTRRAHAP